MCVLKRTTSSAKKGQQFFLYPILGPRLGFGPFLEPWDVKMIEDIPHMDYTNIINTILSERITNSFMYH